MTTRSLTISARERSFLTTLRSVRRPGLFSPARLSVGLPPGREVRRYSDQLCCGAPLMLIVRVRDCRLVTPLVKDGQASPAVGRYLNRLSDFLFVAARHAAKIDGKEEVIYKKSKD
jgi:hypothetical protein